MKASQFNTFFPHEGKFVAFNAYSNEFLILEPLLYDLIQACINEGNINELKEVHESFYDSMGSKYR